MTRVSSEHYEAARAAGALGWRLMEIAEHRQLSPARSPRPARFADLTQGGYPCRGTGSGFWADGTARSGASSGTRRWGA
jgi:hypothetical protein